MGELSDNLRMGKSFHSMTETPEATKDWSIGSYF